MRSFPSSFQFLKELLIFSLEFANFHFILQNYFRKKERISCEDFEVKQTYYWRTKHMLNRYREERTSYEQN